MSIRLCPPDKGGGAKRRGVLLFRIEKFKKNETHGAHFTTPATLLKSMENPVAARARPNALPTSS